MNLYEIYNQDEIYAKLADTGQTYQLVWLRLNEKDNDLHHFWFSFTQLLLQWDREFYPKKISHTVSQDAFLNVIKEDLQTLQAKTAERPVVVFMENLHLLTHHNVMEFMAQLAKIKGLYLARVTRRRGPYGQSFSAAPLISNQLYLDAGEEAKYYENCGLRLSSEEFFNVRQYTDGWRAAVELMPHLLHTDSKFALENLPQRHIDWLENAFLQRHTNLEKQRTVLFSMLDEFPLELVQHVLRWGGEELKQIMENNPILRYNEKTGSYYYARHIRAYLEEKQALISNRRKELYFATIADWFKAEGRFMEAVKYYVKGNRYKKAIPLICQVTFPPSRETANFYLSVISQLPSGLLARHPMLYVAQGAYLCTLYRYEDAFTLLTDFCREQEAETELSPESRAILGEAFLVCGHASSCLPHNHAVTVGCFEKMRQYLPQGSVLFPAARLNRFSDHPVIRLKTPKAGSFRESIGLVQEIEMRLNPEGSWQAAGKLALAEHNYYTRNFKEVELPARQAMLAALDREQYDLTCNACFLLICFYVAKGSGAKVAETLNLLRQYASEANYDGFFCMPQLAEDWLFLKLKKPHKVSGWVRDESLYEKKARPWNYGRSHLLRLSYLMAVEEYHELLAYAAPTIELFKKRGCHLLNLSVMVMMAIACDALEEPEKAAELLTELYRWCAPNGIVMPLVELGGSLLPLLHHYRAAGGREAVTSRQAVGGRQSIPPDWLNEIEKKASSYQVYVNNFRRQQGRRTRQSGSPLETLTVAERKLLLLICQGISAKKISESQGKNINAVKSMIKRTYDKIGAENKADAIRIATEHGIEEI